MHNVVEMRNPAATSGWPIEMDPPFTFTLASSNAKSFMQAKIAKQSASLIFYQNQI
jgi:hypothetical protein